MHNRVARVLVLVSALLGGACAGSSGTNDGAAGRDFGTEGGQDTAGGGGSSGTGSGGTGGVGGSAAWCSAQDPATHTTGSFAAKVDGTPLPGTVVWNFSIATPSAAAGVAVTHTGLPVFYVDIEHCEAGTFAEQAGVRTGISMFLNDSGRNWGCRFDVPGSSCTVAISEYGLTSGQHIRGTFFGTLASVSVPETPPTRTISEGSFDLAIP
jgi:hypothetical protein